MALVESKTIEIGQEIPQFSLKDALGTKYQTDELFGTKGLLVAFTCNHCPYAQAVWPRLIRLAKEVRDWGIETVAINPNIHPDYRDDSPEKMKEKTEEWGIPFPYLVDDKQEVAKSFQAECTPDLYLYDSYGKLFYHGRIDDNWKDENAVEREEMREALNSLAAGENPPEVQLPSIGCSIKWK